MGNETIKVEEDVIKKILQKSHITLRHAKVVELLLNKASWDSILLERLLDKFFGTNLLGIPFCFERALIGRMIQLHLLGKYFSNNVKIGRIAASQIFQIHGLLGKAETSLLNDKWKHPFVLAFEAAANGSLQDLS